MNVYKFTDPSEIFLFGVSFLVITFTTTNENNLFVNFDSSIFIVV